MHGAHELGGLREQQPPLAAREIGATEAAYRRKEAGSG